MLGRKASAEIAFFNLLCFLQVTESPVFVAAVDVEAAYDKTWKPGLWIKLHAYELVARTVEEFPTRIRSAQGSPLSDFLFTAFLNDLSDTLKQHEHGMDFLGVAKERDTIMETLKRRGREQAKKTGQPAPIYSDEDCRRGLSYSEGEGDTTQHKDN